MLDIYQLPSWHQPILLRATPHKDERGVFTQTYSRKEIEDIAPGLRFVEDDACYSHKKVLRGFHGDYRTWKLFTPVVGEMFIAIANCRKSKEGNAEDFGTAWVFKSHDKKRFSILVPPGFGIAYLVLSDFGLVVYKQSEYYNRDSQFSYKWNSFGVDWPISDPILSERDS